MQILSQFGYIPGLNFSNFLVCEHCLYGKQAINSHSIVSKKRCESLELVHSDVCGPMPTVTLGGASYFVTFIDDFSRKVWAYPLKRKMRSCQCHVTRDRDWQKGQVSTF